MNEWDEFAVNQSMLERKQFTPVFVDQMIYSVLRTNELTQSNTVQSYAMAL